MDRLALKLEKVYKTLYAHYGPQSWWPAKSRFEVILGAILTQNTNWKNVEKAIANLKDKNLLSSKALQEILTLQTAIGLPCALLTHLKNFCFFVFAESMVKPIISPVSAWPVILMRSMTI